MQLVSSSHSELGSTPGTGPLFSLEIYGLKLFDATGEGNQDIQRKDTSNFDPTEIRL
jgi:hypothetical protein